MQKTILITGLTDGIGLETARMLVSQGHHVLLHGIRMRKEGFGVAGADIRIGAEILVRVALAAEFETASGQYFDNDSGQFASPYADALDPEKSAKIVRAIEAILIEV